MCEIDEHSSVANNLQIVLDIPSTYILEVSIVDTTNDLKWVT